MIGHDSMSKLFMFLIVAALTDLSLVRTVKHDN
jgi:hypothetical protein